MEHHHNPSKIKTKRIETLHGKTIIDGIKRSKHLPTKEQLCFALANTSFIPNEYAQTIEEVQNLWYSRNDFALFRSYANATITLARRRQQKQRQHDIGVESKMATRVSFQSPTNPTIAYCTLGLEDSIDRQK